MHLKVTVEMSQRRQLTSLFVNSPPPVLTDVHLADCGYKNLHMSTVQAEHLAGITGVCFDCLPTATRCAVSVTDDEATVGLSRQRALHCSLLHGRHAMRC